LPKTDIVSEAQERLEAAWAQDREIQAPDTVRMNPPAIKPVAACGERKISLWAN
jgi:hypothetical protein